MIRQALPVTLPQTAATPPAPHPHLKTVAVTARKAPALPRPPPRLPPALAPTPIPRAVRIKALQKREKRRNDLNAELVSYIDCSAIEHVRVGWEVMFVKKQRYILLSCFVKCKNPLSHSLFYLETNATLFFLLSRE